MGSNKREKWIDGVKGMAIFIVVIVHFIPDGIYEKYLHLTAIEPFFITYGLCASPKMDFGRFKNTILRRFCSIMIPYFLWAMIFDAHSVKNLIYLFWGTHSSLIKASSSGVLWFLPEFFVAVVIFETILYLSKGDDKKIFLGNAISFIIAVMLFYFNVRNLFWGLNVSFMSVSFMGVGYFVKKYIKKEKKRTVTSEVVKYILCALGVLSGFLVLVLKPDIGYIQVANADYGNIFIFFIIANTAVLGLMFIVKRMNEVKHFDPVSNWLDIVGRNSLLIMILHRDFSVYYDKVLSIIGVNNSNILGTIVGVTVIAVAYYMSLIVMKFAPVLAGKE